MLSTNGPSDTSQSRRIATWSRKWRFTTGVRCAPRPRRRYPKRSWRDGRRRLCAGYTRRSGGGSICRSYRTCTAGGIPITSREFMNTVLVRFFQVCDNVRWQTFLPCESDIFAYSGVPRNFVRGGRGSTNSVEDRTERIGIWAAVIWYNKFHSI